MRAGIQYSCRRIWKRTFQWGWLRVVGDIIGWLDGLRDGGPSRYRKGRGNQYYNSSNPSDSMLGDSCCWQWTQSIWTLMRWRRITRIPSWASSESGFRSWSTSCWRWYLVRAICPYNVWCNHIGMALQLFYVAAFACWLAIIPLVLCTNRFQWYHCRRRVRGEGLLLLRSRVSLSLISEWFPNCGTAFCPWWNQ